jgi:hypothetical protein
MLKEFPDSADKNVGRPLRPDERSLINALLANRYHKGNLEDELATRRVADMEDGGMGSIRFVALTQEKRSLGKTLGQAEYVDETAHW